MSTITQLPEQLKIVRTPNNMPNDMVCTCGKKLQVPIDLKQWILPKVEERIQKFYDEHKKCKPLSK